MPQQWKRRLPAIIGLMLFAFALYRFDMMMGIIGAFIAILSPFIIGTFMALLINLPMRFFDRVLVFGKGRPAMARAKRAFTLTLSLLIVLTVITLLLVVIIPDIAAALDQLIRFIPDLIRNLGTWLSERNENIRSALGIVQTNENEVRDLFQRAYSFLIGGLSASSGFVFSAAQRLFSLVISLVFAIYLLFNKERIRSQFSRLMHAVLPEKTDAFVQRLVRLLLTAYSNFLAGQCLQAFLSSALTVLVLLLLGVPYAVLIGLITFVTAFIPVLGPYISGLLGVLLILAADPSKALLFLLVYFIVQQISGSVIYPRIMSGAIDIPSIWVLVAVALGGGIMGIAGMILFIPLVSVAYRLIAEHVINREKQSAGSKEKPLDPL